MRKARPEEFDRIFEILQSSFPRDEYRDYADQKQLMENPNYCIYVLEKNAEICAFISIWHISGFAFIEHFAVDKAYRNCGLGSQMLMKLDKLLNTRFCLEVELPETDLARRRIDFYKRNGFFYNDYIYEQPAYSEDLGPVALRIMSTVAPLSSKEFENVKNQLYKTVYKYNIDL